MYWMACIQSQECSAQLWTPRSANILQVFCIFSWQCSDCYARLRFISCLLWLRYITQPYGLDWSLTCCRVSGVSGHFPLKVPGTRLNPFICFQIALNPFPLSFIWCMSSFSALFCCVNKHDYLTSASEYAWCLIYWSSLVIYCRSL